MGAGLRGSCCQRELDTNYHTRSCLCEGFGEATTEALQKVAELLAKAEVTLPGYPSSTYGHMLNLGMILKQVDDLERYAAPPTSGQQVGDRRLLKAAARCTLFASAACLGDKQAVAKYVGGISAADVRCLHSSYSPRRPAFMVVIDAARETTVLCVRVDAGSSLLLPDITCSVEPFCMGKAHAGLLEMAKYVAENVKELLVNLSLEFARNSIAITGHGFAAGVAVLAMMILSMEGGPLCWAMQAGKVRCYAFGPPPIFKPLWALPGWVHSSTYSFVNHMDCVPRTCLQSICGLLVAVSQVDALPLTALQRMGFVRGEVQLGFRLPSRTMCTANNTEVEAGNLSVVGTLLLFCRDADRRLRCDILKPEMLSQFLLHRDMANDHMIALYEQATADLLAAA
mmetsp:Transcript_87706/g.174066  ORF Transcript_87706/g.174066 Transcript_87706/m.174066 type:complete len:398 (-) Transcript_87706:126-1319(-)